MEEKKIRLQNIITYSENYPVETHDMFCHIDLHDDIESEDEKDKSVFTMKKGVYDFTSYFNLLSVKKWIQYTYAGKFTLELEIKGSFEVEILGYDIKQKRGAFSKKISTDKFVLGKKEKISVSIDDCGCSVIGFRLIVSENTSLYDGYYAAMVNEKEISDVHISMVTTTYKKEEYVHENLNILKETIFSDKELKKHFSWIIVDNGKTLDIEDIRTDDIRVVYNKNTGGSGGFARGIMEANNGLKKPTHILLMDDDVKMFPDSLYRLYILESIIRPSYSDRFIAGAMLEMSNPNIQHEDVGRISVHAVHGPVKKRYDLNDRRYAVLNEKLIKPDHHQYSGWWFCCIPSSIARDDNLPLPLFIRGDDAEYAFRNNAEFITLNGICIWHEAFGDKFSAVKDHYQVFRNDLIICAIHEKLNDVQVFKNIADIFWQELFKFNYKGCNIILDAIEDYLKGAEFIKKTDSNDILRQKTLKDNKFMPLSEIPIKNPDYSRLYRYIPLSKIKKHIYDYTCNGQKRIPFKIKNKTGVIPYGWGYYQEKQYLCNKLYAIDKSNQRYTVYKKSTNEYRKINRRYEMIIKRFREDNEKAAASYRKSFNEMKDSSFWMDYLAE